jgi:hypothetical protein
VSFGTLAGTGPGTLEFGKKHLQKSIYRLFSICVPSLYRHFFEKKRKNQLITVILSGFFKKSTIINGQVPYRLSSAVTETVRRKVEKSLYKIWLATRTTCTTRTALKLGFLFFLKMRYYYYSGTVVRYVEAV